MPHRTDPQPNSAHSRIAAVPNTADYAEKKTMSHENGIAYQLGEQLERVFDLALASLFIVPISIVIGLIFIAFNIFNRGTGSFFYQGERLGRNKDPFQMYKIRTLKIFAESQFSQNILTPGSGMELKGGKFLRSTRLDELPQIFNIFKGEMRFIGPRPLRPAIYEANCQSIPGYDLRFRVKPGLFGYSQILTPHTAPKRIRAFIDNRFIIRKHRFISDILFILWALAALFHNLIRESAFSLKEYYRIISHRGVLKDRRKLARISGEGISISFHDPEFVSTLPRRATVISLNSEAVAIASDSDLDPNETIFGALEVWTSEAKIKRMQFKAFMYKKRPYDKSKGLPWFYVIFFTPISDVNQYVLDQYILKQSISKYISRDYRVARPAPRDQRRMRRIPGYGINLTILDPRDGRIRDAECRLIDINSQSMRIASFLKLELGDEIDFTLSIVLPRRNKTKKVHCSAWVFRTMSPEQVPSDQPHYLLNYSPDSDVNLFLLEKYVLKLSIRD